MLSNSCSLLKYLRESDILQPHGRSSFPLRMREFVPLKPPDCFQKDFSCPHGNPHVTKQAHNEMGRCICFLYVSESFQADIKACFFFFSYQWPKCQLQCSARWKWPTWLFILHFLRSHGALNNLTRLDELSRIPDASTMTALLYQGSSTGYLSLALWCLVKY